MSLKIDEVACDFYIDNEKIDKIYIGTELVYDTEPEEYDQTQVYDISNIATEFIE